MEWSWTRLGCVSEVEYIGLLQRCCRDATNTDARLNDLHWLRIPQQIEFKLAVLVYRCFCGTAPSFLADELRRVSDMPARQLRLRSASTAALDVPVGSENRFWPKPENR